MPHDPTSDGPWVLVVPDAFRTRLRKLTAKDSTLRQAFEKKIAAVQVYPMTLGQRSVNPPNTRHVHVKNHWVLFWSVEGNEVTLLDCGHHDEFFK